MTVACVWIPHFALRVALLDRPELDGMPLVLGPAPGERPVVYDASPEAARLGVRPGQGLRDAATLCPEAIILSPHPIREHAAAERAIAGLEALSPVVEVAAEPGCYLVDLTGLERRLGQERQAAARLLATVPPILRPRAGVGPGKFAARVAAHRARPGEVQVVDDESRPRLFAQAPISLLPLDLAALRSLERLGIRTLGDLAALPAAAVAARFGVAGRHAWELAKGQDDEPVRARGQPEVITTALTLPAPVATREMLLVAIGHLIAQAFTHPSMRHRHVRQARLRAALEDGQSWEQIVTLREPGGQQRANDAFRYRLESLTLSGAVEALTLELSGLIDATSRQERLPGFSSRHLPHLAEACRQLAQRFGGVSGLYRVVEVEPWSHLPERQFALIAFMP